MRTLAAIGAGLITGMTIGMPVTELPNRQEIYVTVSNRKELLVRTNQRVKEGQILADTRGTTARRIAALQLQKAIYSQENFKPLPLPPLPPLTRPSTLKEERLLQAAQEAVAQQQKLLQTLAGEDQNIILHETAKLRKYERERDILQSELEAKKFQYSLEINRAESVRLSQRQDYERQLAMWQRNEQERKINLLKLDLEIDDIKEQETLIRSPYSGIIQKIIWQSQRGNRLDVLIILIPTRSSMGNPTGNPMPEQYPRVSRPVALIGDPKLNRYKGARYCPVGA